MGNIWAQEQINRLRAQYPEGTRIQVDGIPKVYLPEGITLNVQLHLGKELEIAFFPDEAEHEECKNCPQYDSCTYVNE